MNYPIKPISDDFKELKLSNKENFPTKEEFINKWSTQNEKQANDRMHRDNIKQVDDIRECVNLNKEGYSIIAMTSFPNSLNKVLKHGISVFMGSQSQCRVYLGGIALNETHEVASRFALESEE